MRKPVRVRQSESPALVLQPKKSSQTHHLTKQVKANGQCTPTSLHGVNVQQSSSSIYPSTLISTSLIPPFPLLYLLSLSLTHTHTLSHSMSLSLYTTCQTVCQSSWQDAWSHKGTEREGGDQRDYTVCMVGGVKSARSTTAVRSRGCRQMHTSLPKPHTNK